MTERFARLPTESSVIVPASSLPARPTRLHVSRSGSIDMLASVVAIRWKYAEKVLLGGIFILQRYTTRLLSGEPGPELPCKNGMEPDSIL